MRRPVELAILFKDINGGYNLAGGVINLASRVMSLVDRRQIAFTEHAYKQLVDMVDDPNLADHFREYSGVSIKHGEVITIYQYMDPDAAFINNAEPESLLFRREIAETAERMGSFSMSNLLSSGLSKSEEAQRSRRALHGLQDALGAILGETLPPPPTIVEALITT